MLNEICDDAQVSMNKCIENFKRELGRLRTGRANLNMLDGIRVSYYGSMTALSQVAALNVADPRLITVKPWDKTLLVEIEKAIVGSNLGITPNNDGEIIRLPIPPLTGERRKDLVRQLKRQTEEARVVVRNMRRDANALVKDLDGVSEDEQHRSLKTIQDLTDKVIGSLDKLGDDKEREMLEI